MNSAAAECTKAAGARLSYLPTLRELGRITIGNICREAAGGGWLQASSPAAGAIAAAPCHRVDRQHAPDVALGVGRDQAPSRRSASLPSTTQARPRRS